MCWRCDLILEQIKNFPKRKVTYVGDGDGFIIVPGFHGRQRDFCRLLNVDTPEKGFPAFEESRKFLNDLVYNKEVSIEFLHRGRPVRDKYGRLLVYAFIENVCVNAEIIKHGFSMWVTRWGRGIMRPLIQHAEVWACEYRLGLWKSYDAKQRMIWGRGREKRWFRSSSEMEEYRTKVLESKGEVYGKVSADSRFYSWLDSGKLFLGEQRRVLREEKGSADESELRKATANQRIPASS